MKLDNIGSILWVMAAVIGSTCFSLAPHASALPKTNIDLKLELKPAVGKSISALSLPESWMAGPSAISGDAEIEPKAEKSVKFDWRKQRVERTNSDCDSGIEPKSGKKRMRMVKGRGFSTHSGGCDSSFSFYSPQGRNNVFTDYNLSFLNSSSDSVGANSDLRTQQRVEEIARQEAFNVLKRSLMLLKPVRRIHDIVEPITRPFSVYKDNSGYTEHAMFGARPAYVNPENRILDMNIWLSASNSLNLSMNFYNSFEVSLRDMQKLGFNYSMNFGLQALSMGYDSDRGFQLLYRVMF